MDKTDTLQDEQQHWPSIIKSIRKQLGETQLEFGQRFGYESPTAISLIESGQRDAPGAVTWWVHQYLGTRFRVKPLDYVNEVSQEDLNETFNALRATPTPQPAVERTSDERLTRYYECTDCGATVHASEIQAHEMGHEDD